MKCWLVKDEKKSFTHDIYACPDVSVLLRFIEKPKQIFSFLNRPEQGVYLLTIKLFKNSLMKLTDSGGIFGTPRLLKF